MSPNLAIPTSETSYCLRNSEVCKLKAGEKGKIVQRMTPSRKVLLQLMMVRFVYIVTVRITQLTQL